MMWLKLGLVFSLFFWGEAMSEPSPEFPRVFAGIALGGSLDDLEKVLGGWAPLSTDSDAFERNASADLKLEGKESKLFCAEKGNTYQCLVPKILKKPFSRITAVFDERVRLSELLVSFHPEIAADAFEGILAKTGEKPSEIMKTQATQDLIAYTEEGEACQVPRRHCRAQSWLWSSYRAQVLYWEETGDEKRLKHALAFVIVDLNLAPSPKSFSDLDRKEKAKRLGF
jgi:hypothetical protein